VYEQQLAEITSADEVAGGIARVGAVRAALSAGRPLDAARLATLYLAEASFPRGRLAAIDRAFQEDRERRGQRFPALAKSGRLAELDNWRAVMSQQPRVFPQAAW
jgi:hypothetical protein